MTKAPKPVKITTLETRDGSQTSALVSACFASLERGYGHALLMIDEAADISPSTWEIIRPKDSDGQDLPRPAVDWPDRFPVAEDMDPKRFRELYEVVFEPEPEPETHPKGTPLYQHRNRPTDDHPKGPKRRHARNLYKNTHGSLFKS